MVKEKAVPRFIILKPFSSHSCLDVSVLYSCCSVREQIKMNRCRAILKADASLPFSPAVTNHSVCSSLGPGYCSCLWGLLALHGKVSSFRIFLIYLNKMSFQVPGCPSDSAVPFQQNRKYFYRAVSNQCTFCLSHFAASQYPSLFCFTLTGAISGWPSLHLTLSLHIETMQGHSAEGKMTQWLLS